jgi:hypothetical protein
MKCNSSLWFNLFFMAILETTNSVISDSFLLMSDFGLIPTNEMVQGPCHVLTWGYMRELMLIVDLDRLMDLDKCY